TQVLGEELQIELLHDASWTQRLAESPPSLLAISGTSKEPYQVPWEKVEPGRYLARVNIPPGDWMRGVVVAGIEKWAFGPLGSGVDPEWDASAARIHQLREVSRRSRGREITDLREAWQPPSTSEYSRIDNWLLVLVLALFLAEVAVTRLRGVQA
ncbi:MAG TPA: hypothetical protein VIS99_16855, partial [Terrimicrobiaceae bacterium]